MLHNTMVVAYLVGYAVTVVGVSAWEAAHHARHEFEDMVMVGLVCLLYPVLVVGGVFAALPYLTTKAVKAYRNRRIR